MKLTREAFSAAIASGAAASGVGLTFNASNSPALMTRVQVVAPKTTTNVNFGVTLVDDNSIRVWQSGNTASSAVSTNTMCAAVFPGDILYVHCSADHGTNLVMSCSGSVHLEKS